MKIVTIGTLVMCHLLSPKPLKQGESPTILKLMGEVSRIEEKVIYEENIPEKIVIEKKVPYFVIEAISLDGKKMEGRFDVNPDACMIVQRIDDKKEVPAPKKEIVKPPKIEVVEEKKPEVEKKEPPKELPEKKEDKSVLEYIFN